MSGYPIDGWIYWLLAFRRLDEQRGLLLIAILNALHFCSRMLYCAVGFRLETIWTPSIHWCWFWSLREIDWGSLLMVGIMVRFLFGTSLHVPLMLIDRWRKEHFCIFNKLPDARRQSLIVELTCRGSQGSLHLIASSWRPSKPDSIHLQRQYHCWLKSHGWLGAWWYSPVILQIPGRGWRSPGSVPS